MKLIKQDGGVFVVVKMMDVVNKKKNGGTAIKNISRN